MNRKLSHRIIAFAASLETIEFAKWVRDSAGGLRGELGNGLRFKTYTAPRYSTARREVEVLKPVAGTPAFDKANRATHHPEGAYMTVSKGGAPGAGTGAPNRLVDGRAGHVELLNSPASEIKTMANARAHRQVNDYWMKHLRKNNTALGYEAVPLSGNAGKLASTAPGSKEFLNNHYESAAKRHGFTPLAGELGAGHYGSAMVPRPGMIRTPHLGPTKEWTPGISAQSQQIRRGLETGAPAPAKPAPAPVTEHALPGYGHGIDAASLHRDGPTRLREAAAALEQKAQVRRRGPQI